MNDLIVKRIIENLSTEVLAQIVRGDINFNKAAHYELSSRGFDKSQVWRGAEKAKQLYRRAWLIFDEDE